MQINDWLEITIKYLSAKLSKLEAKIEVETLLCKRLDKNLAFLRTFPEFEIPQNILEILDSDMKKLATGYPLAYLFGEKDFWDISLKVTENTLIPRSDTETILETLQTIYKQSDKFSIIDLGTGSGAIAIVITRIFPNAEVWAVDFCPKALEVAKYNANNCAKSEIKFIQNSWLSGDKFKNVKFDCIISNPPYIEENDKHLNDLMYEPIAALTSKNNGLSDIEIIIKQAENHLNNNGYILLEHGYNQSKKVLSIFEKNKYWFDYKTIKDIAENDRVSLACFA